MVSNTAGWRDYDPSLGRFIQRDPVGYEQGPSLYEYAADSPLMYLDPAGTDCQIQETNFGLPSGLKSLINKAAGGDPYGIDIGPQDPAEKAKDKMVDEGKDLLDKFLKNNGGLPLDQIKGLAAQALPDESVIANQWLSNILIQLTVSGVQYKRKDSTIVCGKKVWGNFGNPQNAKDMNFPLVDDGLGNMENGGLPGQGALITTPAAASELVQRIAQDINDAGKKLSNLHQMIELA